MYRNKKYCFLDVTKSMCRKVAPIICAGDKILITFTSKDVPQYGDYVLISDNEYQWIEKYREGLRERFNNIYPIRRVIMNS